MIRRFLAKVSPEPNSGCWLWHGAHHKQGYGLFVIDGDNHLAHRVSWRIHMGEIPTSTPVVRHNCDVTACVNPEHLIIGTQKDNVADCIRRGRSRKAKGKDNGNVKLTVEQVRAIRLDHRVSSDIGRDYGISHSTVRRIQTGKIWKHVA